MLKMLFITLIALNMFDVCLTMPISKITSGLNAKDAFYYTHCFKHVLRKKIRMKILERGGGWRVH